MLNSNTSRQNQAVDAFLECVARCLARRWLKIQRRNFHVEVCSNSQKSPIVEERSSESKVEDSGTHEPA